MEDAMSRVVQFFEKLASWLATYHTEFYAP